MVDKITEKKNNVEDAVQNLETKIYELGYLLVSDILEEKIVEESNKLIDILEKNGNIISKENPKEQELAYPMSKIKGAKKQIFNNAYFGSIIFETDSKKIDSLKKELEKNDKILRFIILNRSKESLLAQQKKAMTEKSKMDIVVKNKEEKERVDEKEIDKEIEELVI